MGGEYLVEVSVENRQLAGVEDAQADVGVSTNTGISRSVRRW
jgi:hypothetical protein